VYTSEGGFNVPEDKGKWGMGTSGTEERYVYYVVKAISYY
jgi:hypothetical protein